MRTRAILAITLCLFLSCGSYVGSANSDKYHKPNCEWAGKIKAENKVKFRSKKAAEAAGYRACKVCKP
jgi:micrococcal nuclease